MQITTGIFMTSTRIAKTPWLKVLAGSINSWLSEQLCVNRRLTVAWGKPHCSSCFSSSSLPNGPASTILPGGLEFCILTVIMEDGKQPFSALSLLFRNAVGRECCSASYKKVICEKWDDDDFHLPDKIGCNGQRTPTPKMLSSLISAWILSHSKLVWLFQVAAYHHLSASLWEEEDSHNPF